MAPGRLARGRSGRGREDRGKIYLAKTTRAVAYGALSAFLVLYLTDDLGYPVLTGLVVTALTLVGAAAWSLVALPLVEPRLGRRASLRLFAGLFVVSAALLYLVAAPWVVLAAVLLGGVAAASADNGPLASLDQATLPATLRFADRAAGFAGYNLLAGAGAAAGALLLAVPGALAPRALPVPFLPPAPHPWILLVYLLLAGATLFAYLDLSDAVEPERPAARRRPVPLAPASRRHVRDLAALFAVDAAAGGLVVNPLVAGYFVLAWGADAAQVGTILFLTGAVASASYPLAAAIAGRLGLLRTMVVTHLPSNLLLALVPVMPSFGLAVGLLVARSALSQMDVPTRQAYTMSLVAPEERATAAGRLAGARGLAQSVGPFPGAALLAAGAVAVPFVAAGGLKVAYDLAIWRRFRSVPLPEADGGRVRDGGAPSRR